MGPKDQPKGHLEARKERILFSYIFMKLLEGRPRSYDRTMDKVSRGRVLEIKRSVAGKIPEGARVLEIGCGTGELASMVLTRASQVEGFDVSPKMVEAARRRIQEESLSGRFRVSLMGVDGMDGLAEASFDAVVSTLVLSELSPDERRFALGEAHRVLEPGGLVVIADEVRPRTAGRRALHAVTRAPMLALTYLVSSGQTHPIPDLAGEVRDAGFSVTGEERSHGDAFALVTGQKRAEVG